MTSMPDKKDLLLSLDKMIQLELDQAEVFAEIVRIIENTKFQNYKDTCQQIHQDELQHAGKLEEIKSLLMSVD